MCLKVVGAAPFNYKSFVAKFTNKAHKVSFNTASKVFGRLLYVTGMENKASNYNVLLCNAHRDQGTWDQESGQVFGC